ncbi:hypothetical protein Tco_0441545 [Tanacetum coccineum]
MSTLTEFMIVSGADNHPPMLDKPQMSLGKVVWNSTFKNGTVRPKTYKELSDKEKLQADYDLKATNIFLNSLPPEWGKFVTDVKLVRDLHTSNYDQFYAYLEQHKAHANEACLMHERFTDPLAIVADYHPQSSYFNNYHSQYTTPQYQQQLSPSIQHVYSLSPQSNPYEAPHHPQQYPSTYPTNLNHTQPSVP